MYDHRYRKGAFYETWHRNHQLIEGHENGTHATELIAKESIKFIEENSDKPFFLYVPFHSVHTPLGYSAGSKVIPPMAAPPRTSPLTWVSRRMTAGAAPASLPLLVEVMME